MFSKAQGFDRPKAASAIALAMAPGWGDRRDRANLSRKATSPGTGANATKKRRSYRQRGGISCAANGKTRYGSALPVSIALGANRGKDRDVKLRSNDHCCAGRRMLRLGVYARTKSRVRDQRQHRFQRGSVSTMCRDGATTTEICALLSVMRPNVYHETVCATRCSAQLIL